MEEYKIYIILNSLLKSVTNVSAEMSAYDPEDKVRKNLDLIESCLTSYRMLFNELKQTNNHHDQDQ